MIKEDYDDIFSNGYFLEGTKVPVFVCELPPEIKQEIEVGVELCDKIENHPLKRLKQHSNEGKNSFQVSMPLPWFLNSFLFPYLVHLGKYYNYKCNKVLFDKMRGQINIQGLFNKEHDYGVWLNYAYEGDYNPEHNHPCLNAGVIYVENTESEPTVFKDGTKFYGKPGQVIIFPGYFRHGVGIKETLGRRLTIAFNLD
jgi:hypothetical protein